MSLAECMSGEDLVAYVLATGDFPGAARRAETLATARAAHHAARCPECGQAKCDPQECPAWDA